MSTRSAIIRKQEDGQYAGIYCHFDGYISGVGQTLFAHYQDADKVKALIELGDISSLDERVAPIGPHSFGGREQGTTTAYCRDRGEDPRPATIGATVEEVEEKIGHKRYVYVYEDGAWTVNGKPLTAELIAKDGNEDEAAA